MANPKGNVQNLTPQAHILTAEDSAKGGQASGKKRRIQAMTERLLTDKDLKDIVNNLIGRSKDNPRDLELLMAIVGEKPKEQIEVSQEAPFEVHIEVIE